MNYFTTVYFKREIIRTSCQSNINYKFQNPGTNETKNSSEIITVKIFTELVKGSFFSMLGT